MTLKRTLASLAGMALLGACAGGATNIEPHDAGRATSPVPGTIGIAVARDGAGLRVVAVRPGSPAARAGLRAGDRLERFNGVSIADARDFERRVLDSPPGSVVRLEFAREGDSGVVDLPVEEITTAVVI
jgi:S1-C subfamily serine protease